MEPSNTTEVIAKPWYASRTLWVSILSFIIFIVGLIVDAAGILELSARTVILLGIGVSALTGGLRLVTNQPLGREPGDTAVVPAPRIFTEQASPPMPHVDIPPGGGRG